MTRYWVGIANRDHVSKAVEGCFCQVMRGKEAPLRQIDRDDLFLFYSPRERTRSAEPLMAFTAIGRVIDDRPYHAVQSETFRPFRRKVAYFEAQEAEIHPLLGRLSFARSRRSWGHVLRRGFFEIDEGDYGVVAEAMAVRSERCPGPVTGRLSPGDAVPSKKVLPRSRCPQDKLAGGAYEE